MKGDTLACKYVCVHTCVQSAQDQLRIGTIRQSRHLATLEIQHELVSINVSSRMHIPKAAGLKTPELQGQIFCPSSLHEAGQVSRTKLCCFLAG
jgi:hypothetical protein